MVDVWVDDAHALEIKVGRLAGKNITEALVEDLESSATMLDELVKKGAPLAKTLSRLSSALQAKIDAKS